jgi:hypothetical protein
VWDYCFACECKVLPLTAHVLLLLPCLLTCLCAWQVIDVEQFEVVVVSPRNHFLFTPMLPSTAVGTVEFRCGTACQQQASSSSCMRAQRHSRFLQAISCSNVTMVYSRHAVADLFAHFETTCMQHLVHDLAGTARVNVHVALIAPRAPAGACWSPSALATHLPPTWRHRATRSTLIKR